MLLSVLQSFKTLPVGSSSADGPNPNIAPFCVLKLLADFGKAIAISFSMSEETALMDSSRNWRRYSSGFDFRKYHLSQNKQLGLLLGNSLLGFQLDLCKVF